MAVKPSLPSDYSLPEFVNGWGHNPASSANGHVWSGGDLQVRVFTQLEAGRVDLTDTRVSGMGSKRTLIRREFEIPDDASLHKRKDIRTSVAAELVDAATEWMECHPPEETEIKAVSESVFSPPPHFELSQYQISNRETVIYYGRKEYDPEPLSKEERYDLQAYAIREKPYLYIHVWRGSGNATVGVAPCLGSYGPGSKYQDIVPVQDTPENCGLEVALAASRDWVRETFTEDTDGSVGSRVQKTTGQTTIGAY